MGVLACLQRNVPLQRVGQVRNSSIAVKSPKEVRLVGCQCHRVGDDASKNGNSDSLSELAGANQTPAAPADQIKADAAVGVAAADNTKAKADAAPAAEAAGATGSANKSVSASAAMDAAKAKKGTLSFKAPETSGAGAAGGAGAAAASGPLQLASAKLGATGALGAGGAKARAGSALRGMAGKMNAASQLMGVMGNQAGAKTSQAAGATYDGAGTSGGAAGQSDGGGGSGAGANPAGSGTGAAANNIPSTSPNPEQAPSPPIPGATNVTPWQNAINTATALLVGAGMLLVMAKKAKRLFPGGGLAAVYAICAIAAMLSAMAVDIGHQIATGPYGQVFQGDMFTAAGTFMIAASIGVAALYGPMDRLGDNAAMLLTGAVVLSGAAAIGMTLVGIMTKKTSYPPNVFSNEPGGQPPDWNFNGGYHAQYKVRGVDGNEFIV